MPLNPNVRTETLYARNERIFRSHLLNVNLGNGCMVWAGAVFTREVGPSGNKRTKLYPYFWVKTPTGTVKVYARRYAWEVKWGAPPPGYDVVNVCGDDCCVAPEHGHNEAVKHGNWSETQHQKSSLQELVRREVARVVSIPATRRSAPASEEEFLQGKK